jgi:hypothetical protein
VSSTLGESLSQGEGANCSTVTPRDVIGTRGARPVRDPTTATLAPRRRDGRKLLTRQAFSCDRDSVRKPTTSEQSGYRLQLADTPDYGQILTN